MTKTLLAVVGPTAIGKTKRAIALANHFNTEIISADSRQFYKEMSIGTAVPSSLELKQAKHHFIQQLSIHDVYSVGDFEKDALALLKKLFTKRDVVIMVGGSALYMDAVLYGLDEFPEVDPNIRTELNELLNSIGIGALQQKLKKLDPSYYEKVDLENPHRLIRALEVSIASGKPYSSFLNQKKTNRSFKTILLGLAAERAVIYDRINQRVEIMMRDGLLEEARNLHPDKNLNALQTVGYKELFDHFDGKFTLEEAVVEIKKNTRRFAKRQLTWYRKNENITWLDHDLSEDVFISKVEKLVHENA